MSENKTALEFYKSVSKTDPSFVKRAKVSGVNIATADPQWQLEQAVDAFDGLYGSNWGIRDIEFSTRYYGEGDGTVEVTTLKGVFFYPDGKFEYAVSGKSFFISQKGFAQIDTDIEKKLLTNFRSKCLSILGFSSDIFMGMFDDVNYVNELVREYNLINAEQLTELTKLITDTDTDLVKFNSTFTINKLSDLPVSEFQKAVAMLNAKKAKMKKDGKDEKQ